MAERPFIPAGTAAAAASWHDALQQATAIGIVHRLIRFVVSNLVPCATGATGDYTVSNHPRMRNLNFGICVFARVDFNLVDVCVCVCVGSCHSRSHSLSLWFVHEIVLSRRGHESIWLPGCFDTVATTHWCWHAEKILSGGSRECVENRHAGIWLRFIAPRNGKLNCRKSLKTID